MTADLITFNLKERGRQHRGVERDFDIPRVVACINSGVTQERVKNRDMVGYYGHWPRRIFGPEPREGGVIEGKVVKIEPAVITTHLKAYRDGTVEHRSEAMETEPGQAVARLLASKAGGWSSVYDFKKIIFWGFDYVLEPNYTKNRGYELAMDSVTAGGLEGVTLDDVSDYYDGILEIALLMDGVNGENARLRRTLMSREHRVQELEDQVMRLMAGRDIALDSVEGFTKSVGKGKAFLLLDSAAQLRNKAMVPRPEPTEESRQSDVAASFVERLFLG